jgi:hypothetical protein
MMARSRLIHRLAILPLALLAGCSGGARPSHRATPVAISPATPPATAPSATSVPVLYFPSAGRRPKPISEQHQRELAEAARRVRPGAAVWFILVTDGPNEIYYVPEEQTPQLRRGTWVKFYLGYPETFDPEDVEFRKYVQVSPADQPFGKTLDVPTPGIFLPIGDGWAANRDSQRVPLMQAFYDAVRKHPHDPSELDRRITHFGHSNGEDEVYYGEETVGQFIGFTPQADGTYRVGRSGTWAF